MAELVIYQQNLHRSVIPTQELLINAGLHNTTNTNYGETKIMCVQEPNTRNNTVVGFGNQYNTFFSSRDGQRIRAAIVTNSKSGLKIEQHCSSDYVVICVPFSSLNIYICNIYADPECDFDAFLDNLDLILSEIKLFPFIITGDFNAKHQAWGGDINDQKGRKFFDFCCAHSLHILNQGTTPTFTRGDSSSFIDISVCNSLLLPFIAEWFISDAETLSDHRLIITKIRPSRGQQTINNEIYLTRKYKTQNVKWDHFEQAAGNVLAPIVGKIQKCNSEKDVNDAVEELTTHIRRLCDSHLPKLSNSHVKNHWWTQKLTILRKRLLAYKRRLKRTKCALLREIYKGHYYTMKEDYRRSLVEAKIQSWKQFCSNNSAHNPWNLVYKMCRKPENLNNTQNVETITLPRPKKLLMSFWKHFFPATQSTTHNRL